MIFAAVLKVAFMKRSNIPSGLTVFDFFYGKQFFPSVDGPIFILISWTWPLPVLQTLFVDLSIDSQSIFRTSERPFKRSWLLIIVVKSKLKPIFIRADALFKYRNKYTGSYIASLCLRYIPSVPLSPLSLFSTPLAPCLSVFPVFHIFSLSISLAWIGEKNVHIRQLLYRYYSSV